MKRPALWLALVAHVVLASLYLVHTPAFEAPDERGHFNYTRHLLRHGSFPTIMKSGELTGREPWHEAAMAHHPPLYYALLAGTQLALGAPDVHGFAKPAWEGAGPPTDLVLRAKHGYDEVAPVSSEVVVFRLLRGWSVVFGLASLVLVHAIGRALFRARPAIADTAVVLLACLPQWSFVHGVLDNGNLAIPLGLGVVLLLARALERARLPLATGAGVGLLIGLALLTKLTAIFLVPLAGAVWLLGLARWRGMRRETLMSGVSVLVVAALVSGAFFARNVSLYGEPLALEAHAVAYANSALEPAIERMFPGRSTWDYLFDPRLFPRRIFRSSIASFGWGTLDGPEPVYWIAAAVLALGALGAWRVVKERPAAAALLALCALLVLAGVVRYNLTFYQAQGRYLFPGAGAVALLVAAGLVAIGERFGLRRAAGLGLAVILLASSLAIELTVVRPAFAFDPSAAGPYHASFVADLATETDDPDPVLRPTAPADGALLDAAPLLEWSEPVDGPLSVHIWADSGHFPVATFEMRGVAAEAQSWQLWDVVWEALPIGEPIRWKVRRVPDRSRGEGVGDTAEGAAASFVRGG